MSKKIDDLKNQELGLSEAELDGLELLDISDGKADSDTEKKKNLTPKGLIEKEKNGNWKLHILTALLMVGIIVFIIVKLQIWDKSGDNVVMEEVEAGTYDFESLDVVFNVDPEILESHGTDDVNTVLCLGNTLLIQEPDGISIADMIDNLDNTEVINLGCYHSQITDALNAYGTNEVTYWQANYLYDVVYALVNKDYSLQKESLDNGGYVEEAFYNLLTTVDLDEVDTVLIIYNSDDYRFASVLYDPEDKYNTSTFEGALRASITTLQEAYPHLRIVVGSPYLHGVIAEDNVAPATMINFGNGNLSEYVMREYNIAMECCVSFIDNYFGLINEENMNYYCNVDVISGEGVELIGNHICEFLERKY